MRLASAGARRPHRSDAGPQFGGKQERSWLRCSIIVNGTAAKQGVRRQWSLAGDCRWQLGSAARSSCRACHCRRLIRWPSPKATPRNKRAIRRSLRRPVAAPKSALMERQFLGVALAPERWLGVGLRSTLRKFGCSNWLWPDSLEQAAVAWAGQDPAPRGLRTPVDTTAVP